ncbi:diguanylate cyclase domain-containing protein [Demequina aurantiaca]|uniref:GGDEF domain-containing protein n=1 Tax=Demequina aurantiaca TaxID=676200 RepID=UPI003D354EFD
MTRLATLGALHRAWSSLSTRGLDAASRTEARAVMGANNFYVLTSLANLPWVFVLLSHNGWSFLLPGLTQIAMIAVWAVGWVVSKRGYSPWMSGLGILAAIAQYTFLAEVFSRSAGFQFALFGMPALAFALFIPTHRLARTAVIGVAVAAGVWVYADPAFADPWVAVSDVWLTWCAVLMLVSTMTLLIAQSAFADFYFNRERRHNGTLLEEARIASHTDALTHLLNRRGVAPFLTSAAQDGDYCVALGDLDRFKRVNDALGHGAGDEVLADAASTLEESVGEAGYVARWGGEEFLIVMPGLTLAEAEGLMEGARRDLEEHFRGNGAAVTISIGVVYARRFAARDAVLRLTDSNLYEAKASGRNVVVSASLES